MYNAVICSDSTVRRRSLVPAFLRPTLFASQRRSSFSMAASDSTGARQSGFTLYELLITLGIAGILLSIAVPSFSSYAQRGQLEKATNDFVTTLNQARSEAMKRNHWVTVCKSTDGANCDTSSDWKDGWIIFSDTDSNGVLDVGEQLIRVSSALKLGFTLTEGGNFDDWLAFLPSGASQGSVGNGDTFNLCYNADVITSRSISVAMSGSVRLTEQAASCP